MTEAELLLEVITQPAQYAVDSFALLTLRPLENGQFAVSYDMDGTTPSPWEQVFDSPMDAVKLFIETRHTLQLGDEYENPSIERVQKLTEELYSDHSAGCCLHILTDDGNIRDSDADFCIKGAKESGHRECLILASLYGALTVEQRAAALGMKYKCPECGDISWYQECAHPCPGRGEPWSCTP